MVIPASASARLKPWSTTMKLDTTIAFVTGANRGIGLSLVQALVQGKVKKVYAAARELTALQALAKAHPTVVPVKLDITDAEQLRAAVAQAGDVTLLINNAGVLSSGSLLDTPVSAIAQDFAVNTMGTLAVTRAFAPTLQRSADGAVVNLLTVVSLASMPALGGYSASKAASWSMTQGLRSELGKKGVKVHAVFAGPIDTEMSKDITLPKTSPQETAAAILEGVKAGTLDIFPDPMSKQISAAWEKSPAEVARMFANM
jgi:short-subunit dehydrogenase